MKETIENNQKSNRVLDENLVMFPAAKNYRPPTPVEVTDDPLEELLNEFADLVDDDDLEIRLEEELQVVEEMGRQQLESLQNLEAMARLHHDELIATIDNQMQILQDTNKRIRFFLSEIDSFMPGKR